MRLMAAARLKNVRHKIGEALPYIDAFWNVFSIANLRAMHSWEREYRALNTKIDSSDTLAILVSADRGMCGQFNSSVVRAFFREINNEGSLDGLNVFCIGKKGYNILKQHPRFQSTAPEEEVNLNVKHFDFSVADKLSAQIIKLMETRNLKKCFILYNRFISVISYQAEREALLPLSPELITSIAKNANVTDVCSGGYEPGIAEVLEYLDTRYLSVKLYSVLLSSLVSEYSARLTAMDGAARNSRELLKTLRKRYNKIRQETITSQLTEIIAGSNALGAG